VDLSVTLQLLIWRALATQRRIPPWSIRDELRVVALAGWTEEEE
jgi:hypothetical protein